MEKLNFCLVGAGRAGLVHAHNIAKYIPNAELVAIADSNVKMLKATAEELNVKKLYENVDDALSDGGFDAVIIGAPTFTHCELTVKSAMAGKHVFCEKPMTLSVKEGQQMIDAANENNVKLQVGFMRRFDPLFMHAKDVIDSGELGEPMVIKSVARGPGLPAPWYYDIKRSNGLLAEILSHDFDSTKWLAGGQYKRIFAEAVNRKTPEIKKSYPDFYDSVVCTVNLDNDVIGTLDSTCPADYGYDVRGEIVMTKGLILIGEISGEQFLTCNTEGRFKGSVTKSWRNRFRDAYMGEMLSFIDAVLFDKPVKVSGYDGMDAVRLVVAGNESIKTGLPVVF